LAGRERPAHQEEIGFGGFKSGVRMMPGATTFTRAGANSSVRASLIVQVGAEAPT
jgi:hypothetical protein